MLAVAALAIAGAVLPHMAALGEAMSETAEPHRHPESGLSWAIPIAGLFVGLAFGLVVCLAKPSSGRRRLAILGLMSAPGLTFALAEILERIGFTTVVRHAEPGLIELAATVVPLSVLGFALARFLVRGVRLIVQAIRRRRASHPIKSRGRVRPIPRRVVVLPRIAILLSGYAGRAPPLHG